jgi:hypothetical protein
MKIAIKRKVVTHIEANVTIRVNGLSVPIQVKQQKSGSWSHAHIYCHGVWHRLYAPAHNQLSWVLRWAVREIRRGLACHWDRDESRMRSKYPIAPPESRQS